MILTYREGCSGSWLAELLVLADFQDQVFFRQDKNNTSFNFPEQVFHFDGNLDEQVEESAKSYNQQPIITCHNTNYPLLSNTWPEHNIYRIVPGADIFRCIKASFYKMDSSRTLTVDAAHEYIKDYYNLHTTDCVPVNLINFEDLRHINSLTKLCKDTFNVELQDYHIKFFSDYWRLQKEAISERSLYPGISHCELRSLYTWEPCVYDLACYIFVYEMMNNLSEDQRLWTIVDAANDLYNLSLMMEYDKSLH